MSPSEALKGSLKIFNMRKYHAAVPTKRIWLFGSSRGKHMFSDLVLAHQKAIRRRRLMADMAEKQGELICVILMR